MILKFLIFSCLALILYAMWFIGMKIYKTQRYVKSKRVEKKGPISSSTEESQPESQETLHVVDAYELELFDDVAQLFFQYQVQIQDRNEAEQLQQELLRKMPMHTGTQIRQMDLGEWSIFWNFYDQSLEYYVGRYGVFYAHVDRFGEEHRQEIRTDIQQARYA